MWDVDVPLLSPSSSVGGDDAAHTECSSSLGDEHQGNGTLASRLTDSRASARLIGSLIFHSSAGLALNARQRLGTMKEIVGRGQDNYMYSSPLHHLLCSTDKSPKTH